MSLIHINYCSICWLVSQWCGKDRRVRLSFASCYDDDGDDDDQTVLFPCHAVATSSSHCSRRVQYLICHRAASLWQLAAAAAEGKAEEERRVWEGLQASEWCGWRRDVCDRQRAFKVNYTDSTAAPGWDSGRQALHLFTMQSSHIDRFTSARSPPRKWSQYCLFSLQVSANNKTTSRTNNNNNNKLEWQLVECIPFLMPLI